MKPNLEPGNDEHLGQLLDQWTLDTPLPPRFQEQVWKRIARQEIKPALSFRHILADWLESVLPRPKVALAYISSVLILGVAAGSLAAQIKTNRIESALSARYIQSLSPYQGDTGQP